MWDTDREFEPPGPVERRLVAAILFVMALLMIGKGLAGIGEPEKAVDKPGNTDAPGYVVTAPPSSPTVSSQVQLYRPPFKEGYQHS